ncbi:MAG: gluconeogenesis factor YvcK family protein [Candidatus Promineifilaceae bacterium]|nr:gluconeogenesis factor YvcK family protein [Candidatus Promineifilaceae bacterium]
MAVAHPVETSNNMTGNGPALVAIGGGTGMPSLLRGLTQFTTHITAIVTVADDGGSSGRLRREFGILPPGDFRSNIAALSRDEELMTQLLHYRFGGSISVGEDHSRNLQGHAFGNLLLAALTGITGSFDEGLLAAQRVLAMRGRVVPSTLADVELLADVIIKKGDEEHRLERITGESSITHAYGQIQRVYLNPSDVRAYPPALRAIFQAQMILIGPGSLYTSILPNLLVPDLTQALLLARAPKVYICNNATQPGETGGYDVGDHVHAILQHLPENVITCVLANDNFSVNEENLGKTVFVKLSELGSIPLVTTDLIDEMRPWRHDSMKLAAAVSNLLDQT